MLGTDLTARGRCVGIIFNILMWDFMVSLPQAVGADAPSVCDNVRERCEGLRTLFKHLQLAGVVSVSGCHHLRLKF